MSMFRQISRKDSQIKKIKIKVGDTKEMADKMCLFHIYHISKPGLELQEIIKSK